MSFKTFRSYWSFSDSVKNENRYIHTTETKRFLSAIKDSCNKRENIIQTGQTLWRAQLGHEWDDYHQGDEVIKNIRVVPYSGTRMKPLKDQASEGRANPQGIPYLYLANNIETAMAEVRPWLGSIISIGKFKTVKELRLIDCSKDIHIKPMDKMQCYFTAPSEKKIESIVWSDINQAFSQPLIPSQKHADYIPTQIIADLFKSDGFDGIIYKSALSEDGLNYVLFNIDDAEMRNCFISETEKVEFTFVELKDFTL